jgi:outer membrane lipoprotein carrier protein
MRSVLVALLVAAGLRSGIAAQPPASEVAAALQRKYDTVRDFSADFTQEAESGVLRRKLVERGTVLIKKPGKMRWTYKAPDEKIFVSDGVKMYMFTPADNQVTVTYTGSGTADTYSIRLDPRTAQPDYDWLQLVVDRKTLQIQSLSAADKQGTRTTFRFSNFKENLGLSDKTFAFVIPRGAHVIQSGSPSR